MKGYETIEEGRMRRIEAAALQWAIAERLREKNAKD